MFRISDGSDTLRFEEGAASGVGVLDVLGEAVGPDPHHERFLLCCNT